MTSTINFIAEIADAKTADLIAFYNENATTPVKKFADRATAVKRCEALANLIGLPEVAEEPKTETAPVIVEAQPVVVLQPEVAPVNKRAESTKRLASVIESASHIIEDAAHVIADIQEEVAPAPGAMFAQLGGGGMSDEQKKALAAWNDDGKTKVVDGKVSAEVETAPVESTGRASNSAGVAASWKNPEVVAARLTRDGVKVSVDGAKPTEHKSTRDAFRHYRLPDSKHIRFRMKLKAEGNQTFEHNGKKYVFTIAPISA